jgi:hypothetical protein
MEITGTIKVINDVKQISDKFKSRTFVVTTNEQYPQHIEMQLSNAKTDLTKNFKVGDNVTCSINIRGREWVNKATGEIRYFNTIDVWEIALSTVGTQPTNEGNVNSENKQEGEDLQF